MESKKITIIIEQGENGYLVGQIKDYPAAICKDVDSTNTLFATN